MRKYIFVLLFILAVAIALLRVSFAGEGGNVSEKIYRNDSAGNVVALSFDDGPDPKYTVPILNILSDNNARATFFVVGSAAEKHPEIVFDIIKNGHEVANHTWSHPEMNNISNDQLMAEVNSTNTLINRLTGNQNTFFRPPKGIIKPESFKMLSDAGFITILWSIGIENSKAATPELMAQRVLENIKPGDIILLHDGRLDRTKTVQALPILLKGLKQKGYRAITVGELLRSKNTK